MGIEWSTRRNLGGPAVLTQYRCKVEDSHSSVQLRDLLPLGWSFRFAQEADVDLLLEHFWGEAGNFDPICREHDGGVHVLRYGSWAALNKDILLKACDGLTKPPDDELGAKTKVAVLFDEESNLVALSHIGIWVNLGDADSDQGWYVYSFHSGTRQGMKALLEVLPVDAAKENCTLVAGYLPCDGWIAEMATMASYSPAGKTFEHSFHWPNS